MAAHLTGATRERRHRAAPRLLLGRGHGDAAPAVHRSSGHGPVAAPSARWCAVRRAARAREQHLRTWVTWRSRCEMRASARALPPSRTRAPGEGVSNPARGADTHSTTPMRMPRRDSKPSSPVEAVAPVPWPPIAEHVPIEPSETMFGSGASSGAGTPCATAGSIGPRKVGGRTACVPTPNRRCRRGANADPADVHAGPRQNPGIALLRARPLALAAAQHADDVGVLGLRRPRRRRTRGGARRRTRRGRSRRRCARWGPASRRARRRAGRAHRLDDARAAPWRGDRSPLATLKAIVSR